MQAEGQRLFLVALAAVILVCGLPGPAGAERARHKLHRGVAAGGLLNAEELDKSVRECGTKHRQEEALKKLRDAYARQRVPALQLAIAICLEHGKEDERKEALQQYAAAANTPYSDPIDGIWARRRGEYLNQVPLRPAGSITEVVRQPPPAAAPATGPAPSASRPLTPPPSPPAAAPKQPNSPIHFFARDHATAYLLTVDRQSCQTPCTLSLPLSARLTLAVRSPPVPFTQEIYLPDKHVQVQVQHFTKNRLIEVIVVGTLGITATGLGVGFLANPTYNECQEKIKLGVGVSSLLIGIGSLILESDRLIRGPRNRADLVPLPMGVAAVR